MKRVLVILAVVCTVFMVACNNNQKSKNRKSKETSIEAKAEFYAEKMIAAVKSCDVHAAADVICDMDEYGRGLNKAEQQEFVNAFSKFESKFESSISEYERSEFEEKFEQALKSREIKLPDSSVEW